MAAPGPFGEITRLLAALKRGDGDALSELAGLVYGELHVIAKRHMARERRDHTLQPTALVNEVYLRLTRNRDLDFHSRAHFFAVASRTMRRVLVDHARARAAAKREGGMAKESLDERHGVHRPELDRLLMLDEALTRLGQMDERQAKLVEMIYFGGLTQQEAAAALGVSVKTVKRDWASARAWLQSELSRPPS